ncbi:MAG: nucleotide exchange factor GrpE [Nitrospirae bacterium]|nr:nucleotide exchange factor GrpE [Nitrospirota bacterium]MBI3594906.1 nucleotide exchange factor GrpE [Nitrospirota bacterium]
MMSQESNESKLNQGESASEDILPFTSEQEDGKETLQEKKEKEIQELNDKHLRLIAEFENFKKRSSRDQLEYMKYAYEPALKEVLPILDNLERAFKHSKESEDIEKLNEGLQLILKQSQEVLLKLGVSPIPSKGEPFDPAKHQAITQIETDEVSENVVVDEISKGYLFKDRVLRPSMVSVSKKKTK